MLFRTIFKLAGRFVGQAYRKIALAEGIAVRGAGVQLHRLLVLDARLIQTAHAGVEIAESQMRQVPRRNGADRRLVGLYRGFMVAQRCIGAGDVVVGVDGAFGGGSQADGLLQRLDGFLIFFSVNCVRPFSRYCRAYCSF